MSDYLREVLLLWHRIHDQSKVPVISTDCYIMADISRFREKAINILDENGIGDLERMRFFQLKKEFITAFPLASKGDGQRIHSLWFSHHTEKKYLSLPGNSTTHRGFPRLQHVSIAGYHSTDWPCASGEDGSPGACERRRG